MTVATVGSPRGTPTVSNAGWVTAPNDVIYRALSFDPDSARFLGIVSREFQRLSRAFIIMNLQMIRAECTDTASPGYTSHLYSWIREVLNNLTKNYLIIKDFPRRCFVRGDLEYRLSDADRAWFQARQFVIAHVSINRGIRALGYTSLPDAPMLPAHGQVDWRRYLTGMLSCVQVGFCSLRVEGVQEVLLEVIWRKVAQQKIQEANPQSQGIPEADADAKEIRPWMRSHPQELGRVTKLFLDNLHLSALPSEIGLFTGLKRFAARDNHLVSVPSGLFDNMAGLRALYLTHNHLDFISPGLFGKLVKLEYLYLGDNLLRTLPPGMLDGLVSLNRLELSNNPLRSLPPCLFDSLVAMEELDMSMNLLRSFPPGLFDRLDRLQLLFIDLDQLRLLPPALCQRLIAQNGLELVDGSLSVRDQTGHNARILIARGTLNR